MRFWSECLHFFSPTGSNPAVNFFQGWCSQSSHCHQDLRTVFKPVYLQELSAWHSCTQCQQQPLYSCLECSASSACRRSRQFFSECFFSTSALPYLVSYCYHCYFEPLLEGSVRYFQEQVTWASWLSRFRIHIEIGCTISWLLCNCSLLGHWSYLWSGSRNLSGKTGTAWAAARKLLWGQIYSAPCNSFWKSFCCRSTALEVCQAFLLHVQTQI